MLRDNYEQNVAARQRPRAGARDAARCTSGCIRWLEERGDARPRAGVPAHRRRDRPARRDAALGLTVAGVRGAAGLHQDRARRRAARQPTCPTTRTSQRRCVELLPGADARAVRATGSASHPLRREIITDRVVNEMVNRGGITFAFRASEETGADARAGRPGLRGRREVFGLRALRAPRSRRSTTQVRTAAQTALYLEFRRLLDRAVRWFLQNRRPRSTSAPRSSASRRSWPSSAPQMPDLLQRRASASALERRRRRARAAGRARRARGPRRPALLDRLLAARHRRDRHATTGRDAGEVAPVYFALSERFGVDAMLTRITPAAARRPLGRPGPGALRDDLYAALEALTRSVLDASEPGQTGGRADRAVVARPTPTRVARATHALAGSSGWRTRAISPRCRWRCAPCAGSSAAGRPRPEPAGARPRAALGSGPCPP